jgi:hypothetical protein
MQLVTRPMRSVKAGSCLDWLYVCVLISSVNTESVPAKNSAKRIQRGKLPIRARDVCVAIGAIVHTQTEAGTRYSQRSNRVSPN